ncbi:DNA adenine methylase [Candidatus Pacearchaeota archaeon]|nr:DNA adenine methylase [Candidatus Pacearchaeota archaeon]|tara:strand:- start:1469 stop:2218 length:750 start_codon:yes stop_codon:yes gene_type:complete
MFGRVGGKRIQAGEIVNMMPPHQIYVEPFIGGGAVFFKRKERAEIEVINDLDIDIYNIFKDQQDVGDEMITRDFSLSRIKFDELKNQVNFENQADRLYRNLYLSRNSFGNNRRSYAGQNEEEKYIYNVRGKTFKVRKWKDRLQGVHIYNLDYNDIIKKYDSENTFFYLDPPYWKTTQKRHYVEGGDGIDPCELVENLRNIKGKFILSYNDHEDILKAFKDFNIIRYCKPYLYNQCSRKIGKELYIKNYC